MSATGTSARPPAAGGRRPALDSLTGLRFFAAFGVFLLHTFMLSDPAKPAVPMSFFADQHLASWLATAFGKAGYIGVSFFFVLSGFVLTWSLREGQSARAFIRRRLCKIFPNHIVMWTLSMIVFAAAITPASTAALNFFLLQTYSSNEHIFISVNSPSWSLNCELLFYVTFPLFIRPVQRIRESRLWAWAAGMVLGVAALQVFNYLVVPDHPRSSILPIAIPQQWFGYLFPVPRLFEFVLGMLLARLVAAGKWPRVGLLPAFALTLGAYVATIWVPSPFDFTLSMVVPIAILIGTVAEADVRGARTRLNGRVMVWLGNISFGFYLCQGLVLFEGRLWIGGDRTYPAGVAFALWIFMLLLTILGGWLLYSRVEDPMMRRFASSRKRPAPAVPVVAEPELVGAGKAVAP